MTAAAFRVTATTPSVSNAFASWMQENSPVAFLVHQEMRRGKSCAEAIDFVCGEGSFAKLAKEIWETCRR